MCGVFPCHSPAMHYITINRTYPFSWISWRTFLYSRRWVPKTLILSTEFSPPFRNGNSMKSVRVVHIWTARIIFHLVMGVESSFWIFKQNVMQIVCFVIYPTSLVFAIVQRTQNKRTYMETSAAQKWNALNRDSE